jgi:plastocyanin
MSFRYIAPAAILTAFLTGPFASSAETGTLKAQFVYGGSVFEPEPIKVDKDAEFCGKHNLTNEKLIVNPASKGIKNVTFYVYTGRGGSKVPEVTSEPKTVILANENCRFEPRVVVLQVGDTLEITNPDPVGHNANLNFFANPAQNPTIPPNASVKVKIEKPEPAIIPVACNIHPWMSAFVVALDHPFAAVSDEDGRIEIAGLPAGEKLVFRLNHEAADGAIKEVTIGGKSEELKKNLIEIMIKPGVNDLGTITIPADALKP